jgi:hypothetical protein
LSSSLWVVVGFCRRRRRGVVLARFAGVGFCVVVVTAVRRYRRRGGGLGPLDLGLVVEVVVGGVGWTVERA